MSQAYEFYDVKTRKLNRRVERRGNMHLGWIAFSQDQKLMAMEVAPGLIRLCAVSNGRTIAHLQDPNGNVYRWMGFTPDGTQLVGLAIDERSIHRWDLRALRVELKVMDLDWDWPDFSPTSEAKDLPALEVEVADSRSADR